METLVVEQRKSFQAQAACQLLLQSGKRAKITAWGSSMYPFIKNGDRLEIEPAAGSEIGIGEIIAFSLNNQFKEQLVFHRLVKVGGRGMEKIYYTKADSRIFGMDAPFGDESILGKVVRIERPGQCMDLTLRFWRGFNFIFAFISLRLPVFFSIFSKLVNWLLEWRAFPIRVKERLVNINPMRSNAEKLVFILARSSLCNELRQKAAKLLKAGVDWEYLYQLSLKSGVIKLIYCSLRSMEDGIFIPRQIIERLRQDYIFTVGKTQYIHGKSREILMVFQEKKIPVIILKGSFLAGRIYGDVCARGITADLDLLVKEEDKEKAQTTLSMIGYNPDIEQEIPLWQWQQNFRKPQYPIVDLHWDISMMRRGKERISDIWKESEYKEQDGCGYYDLGEEELLLYLSVHLINSKGLSKLLYACDIHELLNACPARLNWGSLIEKARNWKIRNSLFAALSMISLVFGIHFPERVMHELRPTIFKRAFLRLFLNRKVMLRNCLRRRLMDKFISYFFFELVEADCVKDYYAVVYRAFFPPRESLKKRSYIIRIIKGLKKIT